MSMSELKNRFCACVATSGYLGLAPVAPGTFGTLPAVAAYLAVVLLAPAWLHTWLLAAGVVLAGAATVAVAPWAEKYWKKEDPGHLVTDEVAGFLLTVALFRTGDVLLTTVWAFLAARAFDIVKLPPARQFDRMGGGWGILLDDLAAAVQAAAFLHAVAWLMPQAIGGAQVVF